MIGTSLVQIMRTSLVLWGLLIGAASLTHGAEARDKNAGLSTDKPGKDSGPLLASMIRTNVTTAALLSGADGDIPTNANKLLMKD